MVRLANCVFVILNTLLMIFGLSAMVASLYIHIHGGSGCQQFLEKPLLIMGIFLFVVSLLGTIGACCSITFVLWIYSFFMFVSIVGLIVFMVFAFMVTNKGAGNALSGLGYNKHRLGDYSNWLRNRFANGKNWERVRSCLIDARVCKSLGDDAHHKVADFYKTKLSLVQSGCCKPPLYCGFEFKNATFWIMPKSGPAVEDSDCTTWCNDQNKLCYDCKSCKVGVLANVRTEWRILAIINACILVFIMIIYSTSCCTRKNLSNSKHYKRYYQP